MRTPTEPISNEDQPQRHSPPFKTKKPMLQPTHFDEPPDVDHIPEEVRADLAHGMGRLLVWMLEGDELDRIGQRVLICAYKLRPDLIGGATLASIAKRRGLLRSYANKMSRQFTRTFGIRGINGHAAPPAGIRSDPFDTARARAHGVADSHLKLVNRFCEWKALHDEAGGAVPRDREGRRRMRRDFEPLARFIAALKTDPLPVPPARRLSGHPAKGGDRNQ